MRLYQSMDGAEIPRNWRREGGNRIREFAMPEDVLELWKRGFVTQAQALNKHFWSSRRCRDLIELAYMQDAMLICKTFTLPVARE